MIMHNVYDPRTFGSLVRPHDVPLLHSLGVKGTHALGLSGVKVPQSLQLKFINDWGSRVVFSAARVVRIRHFRHTLARSGIRLSTRRSFLSRQPAVVFPSARLRHRVHVRPRHLGCMVDPLPTLSAPRQSEQLVCRRICEGDDVPDAHCITE